MKGKILIIEDNREISWNILQYLEMENFEVTQAFDGEVWIEKATKEKYDLILLDLMLPEVDGISIARRVMTKKQTPIIMTTARETLQDRLKGFEVWAVDYLVKPFNLSELLARIQVHIGKKTLGQETSENSEVFRLCDIDIDMNKRSFSKNGTNIHLTQKEFLILQKLVENKKRVISRSEIIESLWGAESLFHWGDNKLDVYISNIRSKLAKGIIITVKWVWYRLGSCD